MANQLDNFFREFLEYNHKNNISIGRECKCIKIKLDVSKPLKRKKKVTRKNGSDFIVQCKYERLGDFVSRADLCLILKDFVGDLQINNTKRE